MGKQSFVRWSSTVLCSDLRKLVPVASLAFMVCLRTIWYLRGKGYIFLYRRFGLCHTVHLLTLFLVLVNRLHVLTRMLPRKGSYLLIQEVRIASLRLCKQLVCGEASHMCFRHHLAYH